MAGRSHKENVISLFNTNYVAYGEWLVNRIVLMIFLLGVSPVIAQDINDVGEKYIKYYSKGELEKASKLMACPETYTTEELAKDRKANLESLSIFEKEFGKVIKASLSNTSAYMTAMTACGTVQFLEKNTPFQNVVFEVLYENNVSGYIVLGFSGSTKEVRLITVSHGLSAMAPGAKGKIVKVVNKLANKN